MSVSQAASFPRLLALGGQGYGYAVAWCLAQMLQQPLLRHAQRAVAATFGLQDEQAAPQNGPCLQEMQVLWRRFLSSGAELADAEILAAAIVALQESSTEPAAAALVSGDGGDDVLQQTTGDSTLRHALQQEGLWPLMGQGAVAPAAAAADVLAVCIGTALRGLVVRQQQQLLQ